MKDDELGPDDVGPTDETPAPRQYTPGDRPKDPPGHGSRGRDFTVLEDAHTGPAVERPRSRWKKIGIGVGVFAALCLVIFTVLYQRCGLHGCPDVDMLKGYMPDEASVVLDRNGAQIAKLF